MKKLPFLAVLFWGLVSIHCVNDGPECETDNCTGKCCGDDGCGGTCPSNCTAPEVCNQQTCECEEPPCTGDSQCAAKECCIDGKCEAMACGALECGPDPVCQEECGPCEPPDVCISGVCETGSVGGDCPPDQDCLQVDAGGALGCIIPPNNIPPANPTDCATTPCQGNYSCLCRDEECTATQCVENCGTCPPGSECCPVTASGVRGCMLPGCTDYLPDPPDCEFTNCAGNAGCLTDGSVYWCIHLCSEDYGPCNNGDGKCKGNLAMECQESVWVEVETCDPDTQICEDGACVNLQSCSMANGAGDCPQDEMCYPWNDACTVFNCFQAGTVAVGGACDYLNDCVPGAMCMDDSICYQACSGTILCAGTNTCQNIQDCPADFGICAAL